VVAYGRESDRGSFLQESPQCAAVFNYCMHHVCFAPTANAVGGHHRLAPRPDLRQTSSKPQSITQQLEVGLLWR